MDIIYDVCCGIDVHKKIIVACILEKEKKEVKSYSTTTQGILSLVKILQEKQCKMVAMESTGSYWKPIFNILEEYNVPAILVNPYHMKAVPGRKTDVKDAEWIASLLQHGLLKASYVPNREQRELKELLSYRRSLISDRSSESNRLQKVLEGGNIKLSGTITDILGKTGRNILDLLIKGDRIDIDTLEKMKENGDIHKGIKASLEQLKEDLEGILSSSQRNMLSIMLNHIDALTDSIYQIEQEIENFLNDEQNEAVEKLKEIPGISQRSAENIIGVIGTDMERFYNSKHLASWSGLCPGNNESAGKKKSSKTNKGNNLLKTTMVVSANAAIKNKDSFFYAQFTKLSIRLGRKKAIVAVAHSMIIAIYHMLKNKTRFVDLGSNYYNNFNTEKKANYYAKKIINLGYNVSIEKSSQDL